MFNIFRHNVLKLIFSYNKKPKAHISTTSKILIDNMFFNDITKNIASEYITTSISNHLTQYLIVTNKHRDVPL